MKNVNQHLKDSQAAARKAHFDNGGTLATWNGSPKVFGDKKHSKNKKACRDKQLEE